MSKGIFQLTRDTIVPKPILSSFHYSNIPIGAKTLSSVGDYFQVILGGFRWGSR